jgi:hypothetical protein
VKSLTNLAATIVFSAAIPGQGGVGHCNEKWPWYWQNLFADHGYRQYDPFRHLFWHNQDIAVWYRQNMFVYANCQVGETCTALQPYDSAELTLIARDTLYRLSRPSLMERAFNRLRGAISEVVNR